MIDASTEPPNAITHLVKTYNYITFFPQIVAGPIVKGKGLYIHTASCQARGSAVLELLLLETDAIDL